MKADCDVDVDEEAKVLMPTPHTCANFGLPILALVLRLVVAF